MNSNNSIDDRVKDVILKNNLIKENDKIVVAVSGGPDSMTLLVILNKLKEQLNFDIVVAHVNHKIRQESEEEKVYVEKFCKDTNTKFFYLEKDVISEAKKHKMGIEEYARKVRYDFFYKVKEETKSDKIAIAHNLNDKIETIMLNMIRGCSLKGLTGMEYISNDIIRPMIDITKNEVLDFCKCNNINPCIDKTNFESIYTRNRVRLELIPMIEEKFNPNFLNRVNEMSKLIAYDNEFIQKYTEKIVSESIISSLEDNIIFNYENIMKEEMAIKLRAVRNIINKLMKNVQGIEKKHILDIIKLIDNNIVSKRYIIGNKFEIVIIKKNVAKISLNYRRE